MHSRVGSRWIHIGGKLKQIDSGTFGIVWGVNRHRNIYCRTGITWRNPKGRGWRHVGGKLKYVSAGSLGVWGVNKRNQIFFRYGVSRRRPQGTSFCGYKMCAVYIKKEREVSVSLFCFCG